MKVLWTLFETKSIWFCWSKYFQHWNWRSHPRSQLLYYFLNALLHPPTHPHTPPINFNQKWKVKNKMLIKNYYFHSYAPLKQLNSSSFTPELVGLCSAIKALHKLCSLFSTFTTMLLSIRGTYKTAMLTRIYPSPSILGLTVGRGSQNFNWICCGGLVTPSLFFT